MPGSRGVVLLAGEAGTSAPSMVAAVLALCTTDEALANPRGRPTCMCALSMRPRDQPVQAKVLVVMTSAPEQGGRRGRAVVTGAERTAERWHPWTPAPG